MTPRQKAMDPNTLFQIDVKQLQNLLVLLIKRSVEGDITRSEIKRPCESAGFCAAVDTIHTDIFPLD